MNKLFAFNHVGRACTLALAGALAAVLAVPACAGEPAVLRAEELGALPFVDLSTDLLAVPGAKAQGARLAVGGDSVEALDLEQLERERGRADTVVNDTRLGGEVANNSAVNVNTGANTIDAGSFANMSGIPVVIQNSGANVLIQNATVINLQFQ
ncbi:hypothetical protein [Massilia niabensis]|uniref:Uncharacterized protein n=1 Tax=Massilia niabensis TaxID=544910 RepID=A0ABW0LBL2_9BURK